MPKKPRPDNDPTIAAASIFARIAARDFDVVPAKKPQALRVISGGKKPKKRKSS